MYMHTQTHIVWHRCQILSLGAGFDTAYWVMKRAQKLDKCVWAEVDFPETVARKRAVVEAEIQKSASVTRTT